MVKKLKNKKLILGLSLSSALAASSIVFSSCAATYNNSVQNVNKINFESTVSKVSRTSQDAPTTLEVIDPNFNENALMDAEKTFKSKLNIANLQKDFDEVLTKFYKTYEYEYEGSSNEGSSKLDKDDDNEIEVEAEIERIVVNSFNKDTLEADLTVWYDVEQEGTGKPDGIYDQNKKLTLKPKFATTTEIEGIKKMLLQKDSIDDDGDNSNSFETDVDDLIELYMGDDDDRSIFGQVGLITQESKYGGLLGYSIKLSDLKYTPDTTPGLKAVEKPLTGDEELFAPSTVIRDFYVPDETIVTSNNIDLTIDYNKIIQYTKTQVKGITEVIHSSSSGSLTLNDILKTPLTPEQAKDIKIQVIQSDSSNDLLVYVTIQNTDGTDPMPTKVVVGIDGNWLKTENTVPTV